MDHCQVAGAPYIKEIKSQQIKREYTLLTERVKETIQQN